MSPISTASIERYCDPVFSEILSDDPISHSPSFILSVAYEVRRALLSGDRLQEVVIDYPSVPSWLAPALERIGPYERMVLADLASLTRPVTVVRGGTGSGKTSLMSYLRAVTTEAVSDSWPQKYGVRTWLEVLDLQSVDDGLKEEPNQHSTLTPEAALEILLDRLDDLLKTALRRLCGEDDATLNSLFLDMLARRHNGPTSEIDTIQDILQESVGSPVNWSDASSDTATIARTRAIGGLQEPRAKFLAYLLLFAEVGRRHLGDGKRFVLVIDNADPLWRKLQLKLYHTLAAISGSELIRSSGLSIVLLLRLSSAYDPRGALPHHELYPHCSPAAVDIVFTRITAFLLAPLNYQSFRALDAEHQGIVLARLLSLWARLVDPEEGFVELLTALSGTNLRNAFARAKGWLMSPKHSSFGLEESQQKAINTILETALCRHFLREFGKRAGRGIARQISVSTSVEAVVGTDPIGFGRRVGDRLASVIEALLNELRPSPPAAGEPDEATSLRAIVTRAAAKSLRPPVEPIEDPKKRKEEKERRARIYRECAVDLIDELAKSFSPTLALKWREAFAEHALQQLSTVLKLSIASSRDNGDTSVAAIAEWLLAHTWMVLSAGPNSAFATSTHDLEINPELQTACNIIRSAFAVTRRPSRYEAAKMLLDTPVRGSVGSRGAVNVFSVGGDRICAVSLRVLYLLAQQETQGTPTVVRTQTKALIDDLSRHHYLEADFRAAWMNMVQVDQRLIYSGVSDHFLGFDEFIRARTGSVALSWAGKLYYEILLEEPVYLQWALWGTQDVIQRAQAMFGVDPARHEQSLVTRLQSTLAGFHCVIDDEHERLTKGWIGSEGGDGAAYCGGAELFAHNAALDVFFRSLLSFLDALRSLANSAAASRDGQTDLDLAKALTRRWLDDAQTWYERDRKLFGTGVTAWEEVLDTARDRSELSILNRRWSGDSVLM